jgi:hypothetical protein
MQMTMQIEQAKMQAEQQKLQMQQQMEQEAKDIKTQRATNKAAAAYGYKDGGMVRSTPKATPYACGGKVK